MSERININKDGGNDPVLYIHGMGGSGKEGEHFRTLFPWRAVFAPDYAPDLPWEAVDALSEAARRQLQGRRFILIANSIGAYWSMTAGLDALVRRAYFISPVVDLEGLILGRMAGAHITEAQLREQGELRTAEGETFSRAYLDFVRAHPPRWNAPTAVLYGEHDRLIPFSAVEAFAKAHGAALTVMPNGEHWFHTAEQMRFLDAWIASCEAEAPGGTEE